MSNIINFGTFDIFHVAHLNILKCAKNFGGRLFIGVSSDELNFQKKVAIPSMMKVSEWRLVQELNIFAPSFLKSYWS